jgi:hypothetical protein
MTAPVIVIPGTFWKDVPSWAQTYSPGNKPMRAIGRIFGSVPILFDWRGANSAHQRHAAAERLADTIQTMGPGVHLLGFSHGGNIACEAAAKATAKVDLLITIATPVTGRYQTGGARRHINLYSPQDRMQILGGEGLCGIPAPAGREFPQAINVAIRGIESAGITGSHGNILWSDKTWSILETLH